MESLKAEIAYAVNDVRRKVFEEGWFGHTTPPTDAGIFQGFFGEVPEAGGQNGSDKSGINASDVGLAQPHAADLHETLVKTPEW